MSSVRLITDLKGNEKVLELKNSKIFVKKIYNQAIFDSILAEESGERQGTHSTLTKGEVRGGGKKPWRQKHTGKARQGSIRNPQWVGGGVAFGPKPTRNYKLKVNSKIHKLAFKSAMTLKLNENTLMLLDNKVELKKPSTKSIYGLVKKIKLENKKVLFVFNNESEDLIKSCNNIPKVDSKLWNQVSVRDIVNSDVTIFHESAFESVSEVFA